MVTALLAALAVVVPALWSVVVSRVLTRRDARPTHPDYSI
jgi:hypothetical protein